jgi:hypothetical protein
MRASKVVPDAMDEKLAPLGRRRTSTLVVLAIALGIFAAGLLVLSRMGPVLYSYREPGDPRGSPAWSLLNPLRDRAPESAAEDELRALRDGEVDRVFGRLRGSTRLRDEMRRREAQYRLQAWSLNDRRDASSRVRLSYTCRRQGAAGSDSPLWITVEKVADRWQVVDLEAWY